MTHQDFVRGWATEAAYSVLKEELSEVATKSAKDLADFVNLDKKTRKTAVLYSREALHVTITKQATKIGERIAKFLPCATRRAAKVAAGSAARESAAKMRALEIVKVGFVKRLMDGGIWRGWTIEDGRLVFVEGGQNVC